MKRLIWMAFALLVALPAAPQEANGSGSADAPEESRKADYTREKLRSIFLEASEEATAAQQDPFKSGIPLFSFEIGGSKTTVRFLPFSALLPGQSGLEMHPIINPFDMTGSPGTAMAGRARNRYAEWWINRKLGFPLSPPKERP